MNPPDAAATDPAVRNVLFIMCDQLRLDALSCYGAEVIDTPNIDRLAARGVRFDNAYVQGAVCGSSRMSFYTGRYVQSHGARWNQVPLALGQRTLGDHVRPLGVRPVLIGKTHMAADRRSLEWLGLDPASPEAIRVTECGFDPEERDDGLHPESRADPDLAYNRFLRAHGFHDDNPWHRVANSVLDEHGNRISGWLLRASPHPAIVPDELSETAYMTDRAIEYIANAGDQRWCIHLSFIKPHWPYVVSEPYHRLVDPLDLPAPHRSHHELDHDHPVLRAFRAGRIGTVFSRDDVRAAVYPAYLGLVKQIDDHLGRLFAELDRLGRTDDTMIVLTADHGDYMGDHWMGEKDWFHEEIVNVPMIVVDPRAHADPTRGTASSAMVEAVDLVPTFVDALGGDPAALVPWLEGASMSGLLGGHRPPTDRAVVCETDYGQLEMSTRLPPGQLRQRRATMIRTDRHKYILSETGPNLLYDLHEDPDEFVDRIDDPALAAVRTELHERLFEWYRDRSNETTTSLRARVTPREDGLLARHAGIFIGYWDEADAAAHDATNHLGAQAFQNSREPN